MQKSLAERLAALRPNQVAFIDRIVAQLQAPATFVRNPTSDFITETVLNDLGDTLRIHHCFSAEPFSKDKFEYALETACIASQIPAFRANRGNPGHDLTINKVPFSLKTQADKSIRSDTIHISKFMELGKGSWTDKPAQLNGLRDQFFHHMRSYDRIITLRKLQDVELEYYELVEIPKTLLLEAKDGEFEMKLGSTQMPKPGYCTIRSPSGQIKFELYFDGGTERKLQIKNLSKTLCIVHATWKFSRNQPMAL